MNKCNHNSPRLKRGIFLALLLSTSGVMGIETIGSSAVSTGNMNSDSGLNFDGYYALMMHGGFGFQADGLYSAVGNTEFAGGGLQFFLAKPKSVASEPWLLASSW